MSRKVDFAPQREKINEAVRRVCAPNLIKRGEGTVGGEGGGGWMGGSSKGKNDQSY
jgi:hypothetical protein